jgi:hypothetical protein
MQQPPEKASTYKDATRSASVPADFLHEQPGSLQVAVFYSNYQFVGTYSLDSDDHNDFKQNVRRTVFWNRPLPNLS